MTAEERALAAVRRLCQLTIDASCRVQAIDQARDTLAVIDAALAGGKASPSGDAQRDAYPVALGARYALRDRVLGEAKRQAIGETVSAYSSPDCGAGRHAPEGCQNDRSTCLCACHDIDDEAAGAEQ
jgi:hypothetical protein